MIKNRMAKIVGSTMAAAMIFGTIAPITANANAVETNSDTSVQQEYNEQLNYAIEEIRIVVEYLDNKDLTNTEDREYMLAFATAAVERVRGMQNEGHVLFINETAEQVRLAVDISRRLDTEMQNIKDAFENGRDVEYKKTVLGYLNGSIGEIANSYLRDQINNTTLTSVNNFLHEYAGKLEAEITGTEKTQTTNINHEQLEYARQEVEIALDLLDNADLTNVDNYDRMMAFAVTAKQRLEAMESNQWVDELYRQISEEIMPSAEVALRLMNDMDALQNASEDTKEQWIDALNEAITYARVNYLANDATLRSAIDVLHTEAGIK